MTPIMPQLIRAVRKFAKIDAREFFGSLRGGGTGAVYSPGVPSVSRSEDKAGCVRGLGPDTGISTPARRRGDGAGKQIGGGTGPRSNTSQRGCSRPRPNRAI